ncbi:hypothetical protein ACQPZZ_02080 [Microbispora sp. CA-135349]|uniref:hypothetical protein n=1 Tax=Microbispora sp. CA-135349 TaxID=3239953 RepID=UPI003D8B78CF
MTSRHLSPHLPRPQADAEALVWFAPTPTSRELVLAWTCDCLAIFFELIQSGGVAFIRKTIQDERAPVIAETHRWPLREAWLTWAAMLAGQVRVNGRGGVVESSGQ